MILKYIKVWESPAAHWDPLGSSTKTVMLDLGLPDFANKNTGHRVKFDLNNFLAYDQKVIFNPAPPSGSTLRDSHFFGLSVAQCWMCSQGWKADPFPSWKLSCFTSSSGVGGKRGNEEHQSSLKSSKDCSSWKWDRTTKYETECENWSYIMIPLFCSYLQTTTSCIRIEKKSLPTHYLKNWRLPKRSFMALGVGRHVHWRARYGLPWMVRHFGLLALVCKSSLGHLSSWIESEIVSEQKSWTHPKRQSWLCLMALLMATTQLKSNVPFPGSWTWCALLLSWGTPETHSLVRMQNFLPQLSNLPSTGI